MLAWYDGQRRELPWRASRDPYAIWVSEIMLQQTRVAAVLPKYMDFMRRYPTVETLASASLDAVLATWSGLGYYRRARALHHAARVVTEEFGGAVPRSAAELRLLPGVGRYTAAAIASIAFGERVAVVDGNVERVLARICGEAAMPHARAWDIAQELVALRRPGDFNQAMMELGATVCVPRGPACGECPLDAFCATRGEHPRVEKPERKRKQVAYALCRRNGRVLLVQRAADASLMAGMWELPEAALSDEPMFRLKHSITDTDYEVQIVTSRKRAGTWVPVEELSGLPLTGLARKALKRVGLL